MRSYLHFEVARTWEVRACYGCMRSPGHGMRSSEERVLLGAYRCAPRRMLLVVLLDCTRLLPEDARTLCQKGTHSLVCAPWCP